MLGRAQIIPQLIVAGVALALAFGAGWMINGWRHDAKLAKAEGKHAQVLEQLAQATVASVESARAEEARRVAAVEEQRDIAQNKIDGLALDVAAGDAVAGRLRDELDTLRRRGAACNSTATGRGPSQPGADPIGLLIELLTGMDAAGREVSEYADRLRIAGATCEAVYDGVRAER